MNITGKGLAWAPGMLGVHTHGEYTIRFRWPETGSVTMEIKPDVSELPVAFDEIVRGATIQHDDPPTKGALLELLRAALGDPFLYLIPKFREPVVGGLVGGWQRVEWNGTVFDTRWELHSPSRPVPLAFGPTDGDTLRAAFALLRK
jgi:hypothetical protein